MSTPTIKVRVGTKFRAPYADGYALFRVIKRLREGVFMCEGVDEPLVFEGRQISSDAAGVRQRFMVEDIHHAIEQERLAAAQKRAHEDFYAHLEVGSTVHYHDGFGQFVRCEVVLVTSVRRDIDHPELERGQKALKKVALVGNWRGDMRMSDYNVRGVRNGALFRPHHANVFESSGAAQMRGIDPRTLDPLPIPEMPPCPPGVDAAWHERMMEERR